MASGVMMMMMKKRKFGGEGGVTWSEADKEKIAAMLIKVLPGIKLQPAQEGVGGLIATAPLPSVLKLSALKETVRNAASTLEYCDFDLSNKTVQFHLHPSSSSGIEHQQQQWVCTFEVPTPLPEGLNEDQARIARLSLYAKTYRGPQTPAQVDIEVCDEKMNPQAEIGKNDVYHVRIRGWREASLDQLEAFMHQFPYHVSDILVSGQQQYEFILVLRGKLSPLKPLFKRVLGL